METFERTEAAARIGISVDELDRLCELTIITPAPDGRFTSSHLRRAGLVENLVAAGIPLDGIGEAMRSGQGSAVTSA